MRRPLAVFGAGVLAALLAVTRLGLPSLLVAAVALLCLGPVLRFCKKGRRACFSLLLVAVAAACIWRAGFDTFYVARVRALANGHPRAAVARVVDRQPQGDVAVYTLHLLELDGTALPWPVKVELQAEDTAAIGDIVAFEARLSEYYTPAARLQHYGQGQYLRASAAQPLRVLGYDPTLLCRIRRLQYAAGDNIHSALPQNFSSVAAAISIGDERFLQYDTIKAYRMAGLSHVLVVSGQHLSLLGLWLFRLGKRFVPGRAAAGASLVFVVFFTLFTGLSVSMLRSAIAMGVVMLGYLVGREPDTYTSLGLAALVLCLQNPYAAGDVGLLLSFAATLGSLAGAERQFALRRRVGAVTRHGRRWALRFASLWVVPLYVAAATLPVQMAWGLGLSLWSLPFNVLVVPLVPPLILLGLCMALPTGVFVFSVLSALASLPAALGLGVLGALARLAVHTPGLYHYVGGGFALLVVGLLAVCWGLARRTRQRAAFAVCAAFLLAVSLVLQLMLGQGTVRVAVVGSGLNPALVVTSNRQAVVLLRDRNTLAAVERELDRQSVRDCVLWVDLRLSLSAEGLLENYPPGEVFRTEERMVNNATFAPLPNVAVQLRRQGSGVLACVIVGGVHIGMARGSVNLTPYAPIDFWVQGAGNVSGRVGAVLLLSPSGQVPLAPVVYLPGETPALWIRPGRGIRYREMQYGKVAG